VGRKAPGNAVRPAAHASRLTELNRRQQRKRSKLFPPEYQTLDGPWIDGKPPTKAFLIIGE